MRMLILLLLLLLVACEGIMVLDANGTPRLLSGYAVVEEDAGDVDGYRERLYIPQGMSDDFTLNRTETASGEWVVEVEAYSWEAQYIGYWSHNILPITFQILLEFFF
ncbi:MAG: hypothetical protein JW779_07125 [Candidatus Thorarchaeota archaeon]|nr:hypothetical protein [Candidatus Thorarchaeota archaeon]